MHDLYLIGARGMACSCAGGMPQAGARICVCGGSLDARSSTGILGRLGRTGDGLATMTFSSFTAAPADRFVLAVADPGPSVPCLLRPAAAAASQRSSLSP